MSSGHCRVDAELIEEDQVLYREPFLFLFELGPLARISFRGSDGLFFRDSSRLSKPR